MKIAVIGSRKYPNGHRIDVTRFFDYLYCGITIVSGHSPGGGVDIWAEEEAKQGRMKCEIYPVDKDLVKEKGFRFAALARNWQIVKVCDALVAFWDKDSTGTAHSVAAAITLNKPILIITPDLDSVTQEQRVVRFLYSIGIAVS